MATVEAIIRLCRGLIIVFPCPIAVSCDSLIPDSLLSTKELLLYSNATGIFLLKRNVLHNSLNDALSRPAPICEKAELHELANAFTSVSVLCTLPSAQGIVVPPSS